MGASSLLAFPGLYWKGEEMGISRKLCPYLPGRGFYRVGNWTIQRLYVVDRPEFSQK
jgi:hypothetical protein